MKQIAVILNTLRFGGAEIHGVELANRLALAGYSVTLINLDSRKDLLPRVQSGVNVVHLNKKVFFDIKVLYKLISLMKVIKPECIIMSNCYAMMYGYFTHFFLSTCPRLVSVQHTTLVSGLMENLKVYFYKIIINRMDKVVFVSNNQRRHWETKYHIDPAITEVIHNGIDVKKFMDYITDAKSIRSKLGFGERDIVVGINAGFRPEKKHEDLVDAAYLLRKEGYPVKLLFIGDGERRTFIENYVRSKNMKEYVTITGFIDDVRPYLYCFDISVLCSVAVETLSLAAIESMAMGKPLIMSDIGGAREIIDHEINGLLYPAGDVLKLAEAIRNIIDRNLYQAMGRESHEKAIRCFKIEDMMKKYLAIIDQNESNGL